MHRGEEKSGARLSTAQILEKSLAGANTSLFSLSFTLSVFRMKHGAHGEIART